MNNYYNHKLMSLFCSVGFIFLISFSPLYAQIKLERELIGAVVATSTSGSNDNLTQLEVDASVGETLIGYQEGDLILTIGFQQSEQVTSNVPFNDSDNREVKMPAPIVKVTAYPNPTVDNLTIDMGIHREKFVQLRLISSSGVVLTTRQVAGQQEVKFDQLENYPNANYFLQGIDHEGKSYNLATVMIIKQ